MEFLIMVVVIVGLITALILLILNLQKTKQKLVTSTSKYNEIFNKYKDIIDLDEYKLKVKNEAEAIIEDKNSQVGKLDEQIKALKIDYSNKKVYYDRLVHEIQLYEEQQEIQSYGLYKPHFDFDTSEKYKEALEKVRENEKALVKNEEAAICTQQWSVNGSTSEGAKQTKRYIKLMLRAFNGECEALIADVRWNNATRMEERLQKSFEAINKMGETHTTSITGKYLKYKLDELRLSYEYQDKLHQEKEEQRQIQEQIREEEKAQKDIEKALKESDDEEKRYNKALEQAKKEMENAEGEKLEKLKAQMQQLQLELAEAMAKKERALSMAQQTKAGHVYIISNIGSFGENVFKIGMTRRLEPMDRVKELGDASVPFSFDVHGIIYSENAPELENILHKEFDDNKLNLINNRKEFFDVPLVDIEKVVRKYDSTLELTKIAEAREYKESIAIRLAKLNKIDETQTTSTVNIPDSI
jgi:hypothetical protein